MTLASATECLDGQETGIVKVLEGDLSANAGMASEGFLTSALIIHDMFHAGNY